MNIAQTNNKVLQIHNLYQSRALSERSRYCIKYSDFYYTSATAIVKCKQDWECIKRQNEYRNILLENVGRLINNAARICS